MSINVVVALLALVKATSDNLNLTYVFPVLSTAADTLVEVQLRVVLLVVPAVTDGVAVTASFPLKIPSPLKSIQAYRYFVPVTVVLTGIVTEKGAPDVIDCGVLTASSSAPSPFVPLLSAGDATLAGVSS